MQGCEPSRTTDLLIEDVAKLPKLKGIGDDAHFCVSFLKKHGLLFEEFILCQTKLGVKQELVLFPATRLAYLFLMINRVLLNVSVLRLVAESPQAQRWRSSSHLDPFAHGVLTSAEAPFCDLLAGEILESARTALRHSSSDDHAKRSVLLQQFMLWNAA